MRGKADIGARSALGTAVGSDVGPVDGVAVRLVVGVAVEVIGWLRLSRLN